MPLLAGPRAGKRVAFAVVIVVSSGVPWRATPRRSVGGNAKDYPLIALPAPNVFYCAVSFLRISSAFFSAFLRHCRTGAKPPPPPPSINKRRCPPSSPIAKQIPGGGRSTGCDRGRAAAAGEGESMSSSGGGGARVHV